MPERQEKSGNGPKAVVKSEAKSSVKSNGALVKREASSNGHKKAPMGRVSANGLKVVKKEAVKREVDTTSEKKKEASSSGAKTVVKKSVTTTKVKTIKKEEKKEKKVFTLPGQKHEVPEERDPLRIFYESLHEQIPESEMAQFWMMEHGLLDAVKAKKVLERKQKLRVHEKNGTPTKSTTTTSSKAVSKSAAPNGRSGTSKAVELKGKRKRDYSSDDDDFISKPPVKRKLKQ